MKNKVEPRVEKTVITKYAAPDNYFGISIALVSDLHSRTYQDLLALLKRTAPDAIFMAEDTLERHTEGASEWTMASMKV